LYFLLFIIFTVYFLNKRIILNVKYSDVQSNVEQLPLFITIIYTIIYSTLNQFYIDIVFIF